MDMTLLRIIYELQRSQFQKSSSKALFQTRDVVLGLANVETWDNIVKKYGMRTPGRCVDKSNGKRKVSSCTLHLQNRHFVCNLQKYEDSVRNITNPNSIYIQGNLKFKGFKEYKLHCYIDTGASLCLASKYVFPHDLWQVLIANLDSGKFC
ncbi:Orf y [Tanacetum coccineum]